MSQQTKLAHSARTHSPDHDTTASPTGDFALLRTALPWISLVLLTLLAVPATASGQDDGWQLRVGGIWIDPDVDFDQLDGEGDRVEVGADSEFGLSVALERRFSSRLGFEVGAMLAEPDLAVDATFANGLQFSTNDSVSFVAVTAGLDIHLTPSKAVDVYFGPLLAYVRYGDVQIRGEVGGQTVDQSFSSDDEFALGAQIGVDIEFSDGPWSIGFIARYLDTSLEVTSDDDQTIHLGFEPVILGFGFGYRF